MIAENANIEAGDAIFAQRNPKSFRNRQVARQACSCWPGLPATGNYQKAFPKIRLNINWLEARFDPVDGTRPTAAGRRQFGRIYQRFCQGSLLRLAAIAIRPKSIPIMLCGNRNSLPSQ
jgi:hypothetical protein